MKQSLDSDFFTRLFVSERKQIALMADEKSHTRVSRRLFATSRSEMEISMEQSYTEANAKKNSHYLTTSTFARNYEMRKSIYEMCR